MNNYALKNTASFFTSMTIKSIPNCTRKRLGKPDYCEILNKTISGGAFKTKILQRYQWHHLLLLMCQPEPYWLVKQRVLLFSGWQIWISKEIWRQCFKQISMFSINLLVVYRESVNLIGYITRSYSQWKSFSYLFWPITKL